MSQLLAASYCEKCLKKFELRGQEPREDQDAVLFYRERQRFVDQLAERHASEEHLG